MDKEKQIDIVSKYHQKENLANTLYLKQDEFDLSNPFEVANCVINLGYRKINENEVVISKADYDKLKHFEKRVRSGVCLTQKEWFDFCNEDSNRRTCLRIEEREQERKETAEKIYRNLIELSENPCNDREEIYKAVFEPYGVEIGEEK